MLRNCPGEQAVIEDGLWSFEDLLRHRSIELNEYSEVIKDGCRPQLQYVPLDMDQSSGARHAEITFSRWRTAYLYTNKWKAKNRFSGVDVRCRYCLLDEETREHLLFRCTRIRIVQQRYQKAVKEILEVEDDVEDLDSVLDTSNQLKKNKRVRLAVALCAFCDDIDFWS